MKNKKVIKARHFWNLQNKFGKQVYIVYFYNVIQKICDIIIFKE